VDAWPRIHLFQGYSCIIVPFCQMPRLANEHIDLSNAQNFNQTQEDLDLLTIEQSTGLCLTLSAAVVATKAAGVEIRPTR
jgi:hypothetical protein